MTDIPSLVESVPSYFAVAKDPESYDTVFGPDIVDLWKRLYWYEPKDADPDETEQFRCFAIDPDNWRLDHWGKPAILVWDCSGESGGTITFYRVDEPILATEVTRLQKELETERRKVAWRPIETAPKDGSEVLLLIHGEVVTAKWGGDFHRAWIHPTRIMFFDGPSHWMPLAALTPSERTPCQSKP